MGIREVLLFAIIIPLCLIAFVRPKIGLYAYIWYALMRPDVFAWVGGLYPFSIALAICTGIGSLGHFSDFSAIVRTRASRTIVLLQIPIALSVIFAVRPELSVDRYSFYVRMIAVLLLVPVLIQTEQDLKRLLLVIALSLGFVALKFGVYGVVHGGVELAGGYGDVFDDNNFLALALAMLIPICWYCRALVSSIWTKWLLSGIVGSSIAAVIMTNSRGGSLGMALGLVVMLSRSKRKFASIIIVGICVAGAIYMVRDTYLDRMETLSDPTQEASAASRLTHAQTAWDMWKDYPLLGVGFGGLNYAALSQKYGDVDGTHVVHNSYLQVLVDSGIGAFALYVWVLIATMARLQGSIRWRKRHFPGSEAIPQAIQTALFVFALGSTFYSCQRMDFLYMLLMCAAALEQVDRSQRAEVAEPTFEAPLGFSEDARLVTN